MEKIKILTVFGTRPEAVKMCPLVKKLEECEYITSKVCVTAQHRQMLDQVLDIFGVVPDYDLNIMKDRQTLSGITSRVLTGLEEIFATYRPDMVLVHGDTSTTFAASLAAFYAKISVGHVEAGLRTFDKYFPFPEEVNRRLTAVLSDVNFSPTKRAKENLLREGIPEKSIFITGNTAIDAINSTVKEDYEFRTPELRDLDFSKKVIMVTAHRRENLGVPLENICNALKDIANQYRDAKIVYLVHLNPAVTDTANRILGDTENVLLLPPLDILETHNLMKRCYMVMTDSGGIQEEAPHLGKPVLVMRGTTERPEAVEAGTLKLIGTDHDVIVKEAKHLLDDEKYYDAMAEAVNPFGDGRASERIVEAILSYFSVTNTRPKDYDYRPQQKR